MKLLCPGCGAAIASADINVNTGIAKCAACNEVINVFAALGLPTPATDASTAPIVQAPEEELFGRPPGMVVSEDGLTWTARWRWFEPMFFFLLFFCIAWDGFLIFWYSMAVVGKGPMQLIAVLFPICHVAIGVSLTYYVLAGFLNSTTIKVDGTTISIRHAPIFWLGNRVLAVETIDQLYCKRGKVSKDGGQPKVELWAALREGGAVCLVSLPSFDESKFLEQQLERRLGIPPRPVAGEFTG